jgi:hypothetical protein
VRAFDQCLILLLVLCLFGLTPLMTAQVRTTGELHGVISDPSGNVVPAAQVDITDTATGLSKNTKSGADGSYLFLNLLPGKYQVKVTMQGFQTAVYNDVVVDSARRTDFPVALKVGQVTETVEVTAAAQQLETTSNQIATTVRNDFVQQLPLSGRDTLQFALLMAGSQSIDSGRTSTFNGLPNASMNVTLDGINNSSQRFKSGGTSFWAFAPVRLDAIDEVTVSTTGQGADASGGGAMNIRFVTKRGTDQYHGKLFEQFRNDALNANSTIYNMRGNKIAKLRQNEFGGNFGGPLPLPFHFLKHKVFFFAKMEALPRPSTYMATANILTPEAQAGNYSYIGTDGQKHSVNVLQVAGAAGYQSTIDPTISGILKQINGTAPAGNFITASDPNVQTLQWRQDNSSKTLYPTARVDYQITDKLAYHGTWNLRWQKNNGTPNYPGITPLGNAYKTTVYVASNGLDYTITPTMLNSFNFGVQSNAELFNGDTSITMWQPYGNRRVHLGWMNDVLPNQTPWVRNNPVYNLYDNLNWVKGRHTFTFGASYLKTSFWETTWNSAGVLDWYVDGVDSADPINSVLTASAFPKIQSADVGNASVLYATLTGRISGIWGSRNVDEITHQYVDYASATQRFGRQTAGLYMQDSFRMSPELTLNYGFRWEISGAITNLNKIDTPPDLRNFWGPSTTMFQPGVLGGTMNPQVSVNPAPYKADKVNPAPNFGFAWSPKFKDGVLGKLFSDKTVVRSSYAISYYDEGLNAISNYVTGNPGTEQSISLYPGIPGFNAGQFTLASPVSSMPAAWVFPDAFQFPMNVSDFGYGVWLATTAPKMHTPYVQNWSFGIQREVARGTVIEARYVGNRSTHIWRQYNMQETNIFESGFLTEFKNAQNNLAINEANGKKGFANNGLPGQAALPMLEAAFGPRGSIGALSSSWTNSGFITNLRQGEAGRMAGTLTGLQYFCRMVGNKLTPCAMYGYDAPGPYSINQFVINPFASSLNYLDDSGSTNYNGLQLEFRKAYSNGFTINANYTFSKTLGNFSNASGQGGESQYRTLRNGHLNYGPTPFDMRHVFQTYWTYSLPFGKGRKLEVTNPVLRRVLDGWTVSGLTKVASGRVFQLTSGRQTFNTFTDSGVVLNGINYQDLSAGLTTLGNGPNKNFTLVDPKLIGPDGRANPALLAVPNTPGVFNNFLYMYGPTYVGTDLAVLKEIPIREQLKFEFQAEALNAFNHQVPGVGTTNITSTSFGQTTSLMVGPRNIQLRAALSW